VVAHERAQGSPATVCAVVAPPLVPLIQSAALDPWDPFVCPVGSQRFWQQQLGVQLP